MKGVSNKFPGIIPSLSSIFGIDWFDSFAFNHGRLEDTWGLSVGRAPPPPAGCGFPPSRPCCRRPCRGSSSRGRCLSEGLIGRHWRSSGADVEGATRRRMSPGRVEPSRRLAPRRSPPRREESVLCCGRRHALLVIGARAYSY